MESQNLFSGNIITLSAEFAHRSVNPAIGSESNGHVQIF